MGYIWTFGLVLCYLLKKIPMRVFAGVSCGLLLTRGILFALCYFSESLYPQS